MDNLPAFLNLNSGAAGSGSGGDTGATANDSDGVNGHNPGEAKITELLKGLLDGSDPDSAEGKAKIQKAMASMQAESQLVHPEPGVCAKTEAQGGEKTFVNVCYSDKIPVCRLPSSP